MRRPVPKERDEEVHKTLSRTSELSGTRSIDLSLVTNAVTWRALFCNRLQSPFHILQHDIILFDLICSDLICFDLI